MRFCDLTYTVPARAGSAIAVHADEHTVRAAHAPRVLLLGSSLSERVCPPRIGEWQCTAQFKGHVTGQFDFDV